MIKTIFFDIDNTLANHTDAEKDAIELMRKIFFKSENSSEFLSVWMDKTKVNWNLYELKKITFQEQRRKRIQDVWSFYNLFLSREEAEELSNFYLSSYEKNWRLFKEEIWVLKEILKKKIKMGIITNGNYSQQQKKLKQLGLIGLFDKKFIIISEKVGFTKPKPEIFNLAQAIAKNLPEEMLYIGDDIKLDIEIPLSLGWNVLLADHFNKHQDVKYNRVTTFCDILLFL